LFTFNTEAYSSSKETPFFFIELTFRTRSFTHHSTPLTDQLIVT